MKTALIITGSGMLWLGQAVALSRLMNRRGFHPLPWFMVPILLGPAVWPFALFEAISGPPASELLRRGRRGSGALDVFVLFESDHLPRETKAQLSRLMPFCRRLVLARVIKAGGPMAPSVEAERFLKSIAAASETKDAELQLHFGDIRHVVAKIETRGDVDVLLRSDQPDETFHSDGDNQEARWVHNVPAA